MYSNQIRRDFIKYFVAQGHRHLPSSSVVPHKDPTLLFCNAGMNQFKNYFLGIDESPTSRVVTSQKCIRVGGKHNDLENVGHTSRHLTLFEMLGNFSFGDYFKEEAIRFAWEISLNVLKLDLDRLWVSVFEEDDEAYELWRKYLPEKKIVRLGAADNFWQMGDVGPCGPCSELLFDRGSLFGDAKNPYEDKNGERFFEFWNLVFMQFNKERNGGLSALPRPSVDTGMGLERIVSLKMGVNSVFETDILRALITRTEEHFKLNYNEQNAEHKAAFHVIVDHLRSLSFAIGDGAQPSNLDRGYVLRKILRRAVRYGRMLGAQNPFLAEIFPTLIELMGEDYPELKESEQKIKEILTLEEEAFLRTLKRGGNLLNQVIKKSRNNQSQVISGEDAFLLKDTYGLPIDEIKLMAKDNQLTVDISRFETLEEEAKALSKKTHKTVSQEVSDDFYKDFLEKNPPTQFVGFEVDDHQAKVLGILHEGQWVAALLEDQEGTILLNKTPFYPEKGGQVGDQGSLHSTLTEFEVLDTQAPYPGLIAHHGKVKRGNVKVGHELIAEINRERRRKIEANHTTTHLLHWALEKVLGEHIRQAGSLVDADSLRFDVSHHKAITEEQCVEVENLINARIRENRPVSIYEITYQEAQKKTGIKQFFGEKYGLQVRVVDIDYSKELCGGCHVRATGEIGLVRLTKETSVAAGVRRIEAVSGQAALEFCRDSQKELVEHAKMLKTTPQKLGEKLGQLICDHKNLQEHIKTLAKERNSHIIHSLLNDKKQINHIHWITTIITIPKEELRDLVLQLSEACESGVFTIASHQGDEVNIVIAVTKDLINKGLSAKDILTACIAPIHGKGGGKAEFAQAGGIHPHRIPDVFELIKHYLFRL